MEKQNLIFVYYRLVSQKDQLYPNAFIIKLPEKDHLSVAKIKQLFPWGQLNSSKQKWLMRFGLTNNDAMNCNIWIDLENSDSVPFTGQNQVYIQLQAY